MGSGGPSIPTVLYGVVINDALARNDPAEMERVAAEARAHLDHYGDVAQGLVHLPLRARRQPAAVGRENHRQLRQPIRRREELRI